MHIFNSVAGAIVAVAFWIFLTVSAVCVGAGLLIAAGTLGRYRPSPGSSDSAA